ncbi:hypothetical protein ACOSQ3_018145 [Xanthoceras sorbifolium]
MCSLFGSFSNLHGFPPLYAIGPFLPCEFEKRDREAPLKWLDDQSESGCRFLWVKGKKVDKEDEESLEKLLGNELMEKIKGQGLVIKNWVDQDEILSHRAVGGFVNYGGWNSIVEATWHGVSVIVWPQFGYQKINAEVVGGSGLGMWMERWESTLKGLIQDWKKNTTCNHLKMS